MLLATRVVVALSTGQQGGPDSQLEESGWAREGLTLRGNLWQHPMEISVQRELWAKKLPLIQSGGIGESLPGGGGIWPRS